MRNLRNAAFVCLAATVAPALVAGCSSDFPQSPGNAGQITDTLTSTDSGEYRLTLYASAGKGTRVSIDESSVGNSQNIIRWDAGDEIMVWTGESLTDLVSCRFRTEAGGNTSATFVAAAGQPLASKVYLGYYPYDSTLSVSRPVSVHVPTDGGIVQRQANDSRHLSPYRPMYTEPVVRAASDSVLTGLHFRQLTALFVFHIQNISGDMADIGSVAVKADSPVFYSHGTFSLPIHETQGDGSQVISENPTDRVVLTFEGKSFSMADRSILSGYLPLLPSADLSGVNLTVELQSGGRTIESLQIDGSRVGQFRQGYFYVFNLRLKSNGLTVDPILEEWEEGGAVDIPV